MTGKTVVPEEAVEAAARAWLERSTKPGSWTLEGSVRAALQAAAPFIAAKALEEAAKDAEYELDLMDEAKENAPSTWLRARAAAVRGEG